MSNSDHPSRADAQAVMPSPRQPMPDRAGRRRFGFSTVAAAAAGALAAVSLPGRAQPGPAGAGGPPSAGEGCGPGGWGRGPRGWGHRSPEDAAERFSRFLDFALWRVGASQQQRTQVEGIAKKAFVELAPLREQHRQARRQAFDLLSAASIDRGAIESLRAGQIQLADSMSRKLSAALADAAEVLTPEQRKALRQHFEQRGWHRGGWSQRGPHGHPGGWGGPGADRPGGPGR